MPPLTTEQIKGLSELIEDAVDAGVVAIAEVQQTIARQPYAVLRRLPMIGAPAGAIERCQETVTEGVYASIRAINHIAGVTTTQIIALLEHDRGA